jgi:hypothetical protein
MNQFAKKDSFAREKGNLDMAGSSPLKKRTIHARFDLFPWPGKRNNYWKLR